MQNESQGSNKDLKWLERPIRSFHMDLYISPDAPQAFKKYDPVRIADDIAGTEANVAIIFALNQWGLAYYNSEIATKHPALGDREFLPEVAEELHKRGLKVIAYINYMDSYGCEEHPEWMQRDSQGKPMIFHIPSIRLTLNYACPSSQEHQERMMAIVREVVANYDVDGIWFDMFQWWGDEPCYCDNCKTGFKADTGYDVPPKDWNNPIFRKFVWWRYKVINNFLAELRRSMHAINQRCLFIPHLSASGMYPENYTTGHKASDLVKHCDILDIEYCDRVVGGGFLHSIWRIGEIANFCYSLNEGGGSRAHKPWVLIPQMFTGFYTTVPETELIIQSMDIVANNCDVSVYPQPYPSTEYHPDILKRMKRAFEYVKRYDDFLVNRRPLTYVGLLYSQNSRDFYGKDEPAKYINALRGYYKVLSETHLPTNVIIEEHLDHQSLNNFDVVVIPNAPCLSKTAIKILTDYVKSGGNIVVTGETSLYDDEGYPRGEFGLSEVLSIHYLSNTTFERGYFNLRMDHSASKDVEASNPFFFIGREVMFETLREQEIIADRVLPLHAKGLDIYPGDRLPYPAIVKGRFEKGTTVYSGVPIDASYFQAGNLAFRALMKNLVREASSKDYFFETDAPTTVMITQYRQDNRYLIHFVNYTVNQQSISGKGNSGVIDVIPIHDIHASLRLGEGEKPLRVYIAPEPKEQIEYKFEGGMVLFTVPKLEIHQLVVIETE